MTVIDNILNEWSFRCHDGIVDLNDPIKLSILNEILKEYNLVLNESNQSFENYISTKNFSSGVVKQLLNIDSNTQNRILNFVQTEESNNISAVIAFINSLPNKAELSKIKFSSTNAKNEGEGETLLIVSSKNGMKISGRKLFGDVEIGNNKYEVKKGNSFRAGGTYRKFINRFLFELNYLKYNIFESEEYSEAFKKALGPEIVGLWNKLIQNGENEVNFTNIAIKKFEALNTLLVALKNKLSSIDFQENELQSIADEAVVTLKNLIKRPLFGTNIGDEIKNEFISEVDGLINIDPSTYEYKLYDKETFNKDWNFTAIAGGNRPIFTLKNQEPIDEEYYEEN
jgi:hypothetical protein